MEYFKTTRKWWIISIHYAFVISYYFMHYHTHKLLLLHNRFSTKTYAPSLKGGINTLILRIHVQYKRNIMHRFRARPTFWVRIFNMGRNRKLPQYILLLLLILIFTIKSIWIWFLELSSARFNHLTNRILFLN